MTARGTSVLLGLLALALVAASPAAAAGPNLVLQEKSLQLSIPLGASDGYSARIDTAGHHQVSLTVSKGWTIAVYRTLGTVSRKGVRADFGRFGRVNLHFRAKAKPHPQPLAVSFLSARFRCRGRREVSERGVFRGRVHLAGVHGFTRIRGHRLGGSVDRGYKVVCHLGRRRARAAAAREAEPKSLAVAAVAHGNGIRRAFIAASLVLGIRRGRPLGFAIAAGSRRQKVGRVLVTDYALMIAEPLTDSHPKKGVVAATVALPKPFEGSATYRVEGGRDATWEGDFGVRLPGRGTVSLAGPEFEALLCELDGKAGQRCVKSLNGLVEPLARALALPYGSGSHSQLLALARLSSLR